jgi:hypothetical protein
VHPAIPQLLQLQKTDQEIALFRAELDAAPRRIRELDQKLTGARSDVISAKEAHALVVAARKKAEFEVAEWRERGKKFRSQSSAVKTNEAYKALQHEIANADAQAAKAEDAQLEQMMAAEEGEKKLKAAEAELKEAEQSVAADRKAIENHARESNRKMLADIPVRDKLAAELPEEIVTLYTRAAKRHHGVALAEAVNEQCRGCGMRLLPHLYQQVYQPQDQDIHTCENCGRILYAAEIVPAANPNPSAASAS